MSEKWEREIDELLRRREAKLRREPVSRRFARRSAPFRSNASGVFRSILRFQPSEQFMIASIFLVAVAFGLSIIPSAAGIARWASLLSLLFFVLGLALAVMGRRGPGQTSNKRWRDRDVSYGGSNSSQPTVWDQLRTWWRRRRFRKL
jgi:ABC-type multidrug transport system fused ATPase/permease subunit